MKLVQFAGLWTLVHHPSRQQEWPLDRKLRSIKAADFAGVCARLDAPIASLTAKHKLFAVGLIFPDQPAEFVRLLRIQKDLGAEQVCVQLGTHDTRPAEAVKRWIQLENEAEKLGLVVSLETHRDSATETPEKLFEIADLYEKLAKKPLRLAWDFSHFGVVKHLSAAQCVDRLLARPELIRNAIQFHFRPFSSHHAQLPVTHKGKLTPETIDYLDFVQEVMRIWKAEPSNQNKTLLACPSLGPKGGYALSNFPPVWPDALELSSQLTKRWNKAK